MAEATPPTPETICDTASQPLVKNTSVTEQQQQLQSPTNFLHPQEQQLKFVYNASNFFYNSSSSESWVLPTNVAEQQQRQPSFLFNSEYPLEIASSYFLPPPLTTSNIITNTADSTTILIPVSPTSTILVENVFDVFPVRTDDTFKLTRISVKEFRDNVANAIPYILFKRQENPLHILYYVSGKMDDLNRKRFCRELNGCEVLNARTGLENVNWSKLHESYMRLPLPLRINERKMRLQQIRNSTVEGVCGGENILKKKRVENADTRLGFRFKNTFAAKSFFTFGERRVSSDEIHILQTHTIPLLYFQPKEKDKKWFENEWKKCANLLSYAKMNCYGELKPDLTKISREGLFDPEDQRYFNTYVLCPNSTYAIRENTVYVLMTVQKTLFRLDRISLNKFNEIMHEENSYWRNTIKNPDGCKKLVTILANNSDDEGTSVPLPVLQPPKRIKIEDDGEKSYCFAQQENIITPCLMTRNVDDSSSTTNIVVTPTIYEDISDDDEISTNLAEDVLKTAFRGTEQLELNEEDWNVDFQ